MSTGPSYTYAEAIWTQGLPDWIGAHVRMLGFFGGAPGQLVSDNLRAGITKACFYEPKVNRTYADLATIQRWRLTNASKKPWFRNRIGGAAETHLK